MSFKFFRCVECGLGKVRPLARPGRTMRYRTMMLEIPADLLIPTCDHCGEEWIDESTSRLLDRALEGEYRVRLALVARQSLEILSSHTTLKELEQLLGLSHGYLSKVGSGQRNPSPELASHLALLATDPAARLSEVRSLWKNAAA